MSLELLRLWARVEVWGDIRRIRDRALHVVLSHDITIPEPEDESARFAVALDESRFCFRTLKDLEEEHGAIVRFLEAAAPDLLGAVPLIPEEGPTPEDGANRAQAMAGVLGAFLMRSRPTITIGALEPPRGDTIGPLSVAEWSIAIGCGETKTRSLFEQWGIENLHGSGYSVPQSKLTEQQRTKAQEQVTKRQAAAQASIEKRKKSSKLKRAMY